MRYLGIDVHSNSLVYACVGAGYELVEANRLLGPLEGQIVAIVQRIHEIGDANGELVVGVDAPRMPLGELREVRWDSTTHEWGPCAPCRGRHCEIVVSCLGLAVPQWTGLIENCPTWMQHGFQLFAALEAANDPHIAAIYEVFPRVSYQRLSHHPETKLCFNFARFDGSTQYRSDLLDACMAAITVGEYAANLGQAVGGGDNLGAIVLPRPVDDPGLNAGVLQWPPGHH